MPLGTVTRLCGAKNKRNGEKCKNPAMENGRCRLHGGKVPKGLALPQTKSGRYSKHLPTYLAGQYESMRNDQELLNLREEVALATSHLQDLLDRLQSGETRESWEALRDLAGQLRESHNEKDTKGFFDCALQMAAVIEGTPNQGELWEEIHKTLETRRKLVDSEGKRVKTMHEMVSVDRAMLYLGAMASAVKTAVERYVKDDEARTSVLRFVSDEFSRLTPATGA